MAISSDFFQEGPLLKNPYDSDGLLRLFLRWRLPGEVLKEIEPGLTTFGERIVGEVQTLGDRAESQLPRHVPFDPWGRRIDHIEVSEAWEKLHGISAEEGLVAIGYERAHGAFSRVHQFTKLYLFHPSSAFYTCPLAMTDGAARVLELYGDMEMKSRAFRKLISRDPHLFWTSGQWMTERTGGSDVSGTSTVARAVDGSYRLRGDKWFTSAVTAQMSLGLAKVEGATDAREGLSLFYIELRDHMGALQGLRVERLKDKLGTKALPTAELHLEGTPATLIGGVGEGVKRISALLNITRSYNAICALATMARALVLAKDYAHKRKAFGRQLSELPLHLQTLAQAQAEFEGCFHLTFHLAHLLGREETGQATEGERLTLRLLTPLAKLWTGKQSVTIVSEMIESIGGAAYVEDTGLPRLLRDAQVFPIWEGTTNVLSLDVLRAIAKDGALNPFLADIEARLSQANDMSLRREREVIEQALCAIREHVQAGAALEPDTMQATARALALGLARVYAASLLLEFAHWCHANQQRSAALDVVRRFCRQPLVSFVNNEDLDKASSERIVYG